jgi:hypothetical protein
MTKPDSGLFKDTSGIDDFYGDAERVIAERVQGLDLTPHPVKQKQLSSKQNNKIKSKIAQRKATREEYKRYIWNKRFKRRRDEGVINFWLSEQSRIENGQPTTRNWTKEQQQAILNGGKPTFNGRALAGHHTYSATQYPHLANMAAVIYPATFTEHLKGWHGGNYKNSLPGKRIRRIEEL